MRKNKRERGFSLVELSVVIVLAGMVISALSLSYFSYYSTYLYHKTYGQITNLNDALSNYGSSMGRLPLPSDPTQPIGSPNAGCQCGVCGVNEGVACLHLKMMPVGGCYNGICKEAGARLTPANQTAGAATDPVYFGGIPYKTIDAALASGSQIATVGSTVDPWGYQINYAVSEGDIYNSSYGQGDGVLNVQSETGTNLVEPPDTINYIIWSAGQNHMGAYTSAGVMGVPCHAGEVDSANCNHQWNFADGLYNIVQGSPKYFDDIMIYSSFTLTQLWSFTAPNSNDVYNKNPGYVGVGTGNADPTQELEVNGTLYTNGSIYLNAVCHAGSCTHSWAPNILGGPASGTNASNNNVSAVCGAAPPGKMNVINGMQYGQIQCGTPIDVPQANANSSCPSGMAYGIDSAGKVICN